MRRRGAAAKGLQVPRSSIRLPAPPLLRLQLPKLRSHVARAVYRELASTTTTSTTNNNNKMRFEALKRAEQRNKVASFSICDNDSYDEQISLWTESHLGSVMYPVNIEHVHRDLNKIHSPGAIIARELADVLKGAHHYTESSSPFMPFIIRGFCIQPDPSAEEILRDALKVPDECELEYLQLVDGDKVTPVIERVSVCVCVCLCCASA